MPPELVAAGMPETSPSDDGVLDPDDARFDASEAGNPPTDPPAVPGSEAVPGAVDERGVPLNNRLRELERKLEVAESMNLKLVDQLTKVTSPLKPGDVPPVPEEAKAPSLKEFFGDEAYEDPDKFIAKIDEWMTVRMDQREKDYQKLGEEHRTQAQKSAEVSLSYLKKADELFGSDQFGRILKTGPNGPEIDHQSKLLQLANQIKQKNKSLWQQADGDFIAIAEAYARLSRGAGPAALPHNGIDALGRIQGRGGSDARPAAGGPLMDKRTGNFLREATDAEYRDLSEALKNAYDQWDVSIRMRDK